MAKDTRVNASENGLLRSKLAGSGGSLVQAFEQLELGDTAYPVVRHRQRGMLSARVPLDQAEGEGYWELQKIDDDFYVVISDCCYVGQRVEEVRGLGLLEFHYRISGPSRITREDSEAIELSSPSAYICRFDEGTAYTIRNVPGVESSQVNIYCRPDWFRKNFGICESRLSRRWFEWIESELSVAQYFHLHLTDSMLRVVRELLECQYTDNQRLVYFEAKVAELLCLTLDCMGALGEDALAGEVFSDADIDKLTRARHILETEFDPSPTITELSRRLGTNETKLKRGCKLFFGTTLFELGRRARLEHALVLLVDRKLSINAVANQVGYKYSSSFSAAFKEHFGILPKEARKLKMAGDLTPGGTRE